MKRKWLIICGLVVATSMVTATPTMGVDSVGSDFFREWYQWGELAHYLDNFSDYTIYEAETTGEWSLPEQNVFSVNGNSFKWNRYYLDGFRLDSRMFAGSMLYHANMMEHSLALDYHRGNLHFMADSTRVSRVSLSGNAGGLGGIAPGTKAILNVQHKSGAERLYKQEALTNRMHLLGGGQVEAVYGIHAFGQTFYQHAYANYGVRRLLKMDYQGFCGTFDTPYYKAQVDGTLPLPRNKVVDRLGYIFSAQGRGDTYSEFMFNHNELAQQQSYTLSIYGTKDYGRTGKLTTGLTWALHDIRHQELNFTRNIIDQDGEAFEPWYADGKTNELNWAVNYQYAILPWLRLKIDTYNSLIHFTPNTAEWHNEITYQTLGMATPLSLYRYDWTSATFTSGLLENALTIEADKQVLPWLRLQGIVGATLDGIALCNKSVITPSWEAMFGMHFTPAKWFTADIVMANYRTRYTYDDVRYLSDDYLNGVAHYADGTLLTTTGGKYHQPDKKLLQPQYFVLDIPFRFTIGRHEISVLSSLKKYYNLWTTTYAGDTETDYVAVGVNQDGNDHLDYNVYAMKGIERHYLVTNAPAVGPKFFLNTPLFASNEIKYAYHGKKVFFAFSWQSYCVSGTSALGNGVLSNNIGVLSESTASPNISLNNANMAQNDPEIRSLGRLDQDRAYVARLHLGVNITDNWQLSLSGKFKDGTPMTNFRSLLYTDAAGHQQAVIWNADTRGDNTVDAHFGKREDSFFNFDLRLRYRGLIKGLPFSAEATCYNFWDFGTALGEYTFDYWQETGKDVPGHRYALQLCVPRGLIVKVNIGLEKITQTTQTTQK